MLISLKILIETDVAMVEVSHVNCLAVLGMATSLFFSVWRPRAGRFRTTKVAKQTKENFHKIHFFQRISFHCVANAYAL
jgi:hypothetical protein